MFEMMMLLGFVYAGCCCLLPDRYSSPRFRRPDVLPKILSRGTRRRGKSVQRAMQRCRPPLASSQNNAWFMSPTSREDRLG